MKRFWLFRSNLKNLEYYNKYTTLDEFVEKCHDFYLLQGLWFLENDDFDEVRIIRIVKKPKKQVMFDVNGKKFIQDFVTDFNKVFKRPKPDVTFFRGGFPEYDKLTKKDPKFFGMKLYLGSYGDILQTNNWSLGFEMNW